MAEIELAEVGHSFTAEEVECETDLLMVADDAAAASGGDANLSSFPRSCANTWLSFVGAGILGLPFAFKQVGAAPAAVILVLVAMLSTHCMLQVVRCKRVIVEELGKPVHQFGDVGFWAFGKPGAFLVDAAKEGPVLVHCAHGVGRSTATLVAALVEAGAARAAMIAAVRGLGLGWALGAWGIGFHSANNASSHKCTN